MEPIQTAALLAGCCTIAGCGCAIFDPETVSTLCHTNNTQTHSSSSSNTRYTNNHYSSNEHLSIMSRAVDSVFGFLGCYKAEQHESRYEYARPDTTTHHLNDSYDITTNTLRNSHEDIHHNLWTDNNNSSNNTLTTTSSTECRIGEQNDKSSNITDLNNDPWFAPSTEYLQWVRKDSPRWKRYIESQGQWRHADLYVENLANRQNTVPGAFTNKNGGIIPMPVMDPYFSTPEPLSAYFLRRAYARSLLEKQKIYYQQQNAYCNEEAWDNNNVTDQETTTTS